MHDSDDDQKTSFLGTALAVGMIVFGIVTMVASGPLQVGAWVAMISCMGGTIANDFFEYRERKRKRSWPESEQNIGVAANEAEAVELSHQRSPSLPEKSWVASLDNQPRGTARYH
jgi:uncharacterized membrane protein